MLSFSLALAGMACMRLRRTRDVCWGVAQTLRVCATPQQTSGERRRRWHEIRRTLKRWLV